MRPEIKNRSRILLVLLIISTFVALLFSAFSLNSYYYQYNYYSFSLIIIFSILSLIFLSISFYLAIKVSFTYIGIYVKKNAESIVESFIEDNSHLVDG